MFDLEKEIYIVENTRTKKEYIMSKKEVEKFLQTNSDIIDIYEFAIFRDRKIDMVEFANNKAKQLSLFG